MDREVRGSSVTWHTISADATKEHHSLSVATDSPRRGSVPPSPEAASQIEKPPMSSTLLSGGGNLQSRRQRSMSDIRSTSSQQQQQLIPHGRQATPDLTPASAI